MNNFSQLKPEVQNKVLDTCQSLMGSNAVPREFMILFLTDPNEAKNVAEGGVKLGATDYYAIALEVAKGICSAAAVVCPIIQAQN